MSIAQAELGVRTWPAGSTNPRITGYHDGTNIAGYDDKASWCSSCVNWVLRRAGISGTGSALARSWLVWGEPLHNPVPGCIAVLSREDPNGWKGHVGFFLRADAGKRVPSWRESAWRGVREHFYALASVLAYRWPRGVGR